MYSFTAQQQATLSLPSILPIDEGNQTKKNPSESQLYRSSITSVGKRYPMRRPFSRTTSKDLNESSVRSSTRIYLGEDDEFRTIKRRSSANAWNPFPRTRAVDLEITRSIALVEVSEIYEQSEFKDDDLKNTVLFQQEAFYGPSLAPSNTCDPAVEQFVDQAIQKEMAQIPWDRQVTKVDRKKQMNTKRDSFKLLETLGTFASGLKRNNKQQYESKFITNKEESVTLMRDGLSLMRIDTTKTDDASCSEYGMELLPSTEFDEATIAETPSPLFGNYSYYFC